MLVVTLQAQQKKPQNIPTFDSKIFHMGFSLGFNSMSHRLALSSDILDPEKTPTVYGVEPVSEFGFGLGVLADLRLNNYLNLRTEPGLDFGQRNLEYRLRTAGGLHEYSYETYTMRISSICAYWPILLKFRSVRINNYRPYVIGGGSVRYDFESRRKNQANTDYTIKTNPFDVYAEVGAGVDFYLPYFKFAMELRYCFGFMDIMRHEPEEEYNRVLQSMKSKIIMLTFHFE